MGRGRNASHINDWGGEIKTRVRFFFAIFVALVVATGSATAQRMLMHYWNFNNVVSGAKGPHPIRSDHSIVDSAWMVWQALPGVVSDTGWVDTIGGDIDTQNTRFFEKPGNALRTRNPSDSMEFRWYLPTRGFKNLVLIFDCMRSNDGQTTQNYDYSTDGGVSFTTAGLPFVTKPAPTAWTLLRMDLSTCPAWNDQPMVIFRIRYTGNTKSNSGHNRFDNVSLEGDSINGVADINEHMRPDLRYALYPNPSIANNMVSLALPPGSPRTVILVNSIGTIVAGYTVYDSHFEFSLRSLPAGMYRIVVRGSQGELLSSMPLVRE